MTSDTSPVLISGVTGLETTKDSSANLQAYVFGVGVSAPVGTAAKRPLGSVLFGNKSEDVDLRTQGITRISYNRTPARRNIKPQIGGELKTFSVQSTGPLWMELVATRRRGRGSRMESASVWLLCHQDAPINRLEIPLLGNPDSTSREVLYLGRFWVATKAILSEFGVNLLPLQRKTIIDVSRNDWVRAQETGTQGLLDVLPRVQLVKTEKGYAKPVIRNARRRAID